MGTEAHAALQVAPDLQEAETPDDGLGAIREELREHLAVEQARHAQLADELATVKARESSLAKALSALSNEAPAPPAPPKHGASGWVPSEDKVAAVFAAVLAAGEPVTQTQVATATRQAGETTRRCMELLRERQLIRLVGTTRGGGRTFAAMPGAVATAVAPQAPKTTKSTNQWTPSPERVDAVLAALVEIGGPTGTVPLAERSGESAGVVRNALAALVEDGRAVITGTHPQNARASLYAVAPEATA